MLPMESGARPPANSTMRRNGSSFLDIDPQQQLFQMPAQMSLDHLESLVPQPDVAGKRDVEIDEMFTQRRELIRRMS
jgi:hypothetical protein